MPDIFVSPDEKIKVDSPSVLPDKVPTTESQKSIPGSHSHSRFSAFKLYPDDVDFETREDKEKIVLMLRQHLAVNFKWVAFSLLLLFGPSILARIGILALLPGRYSFILSLVWYLITFTYALEGFLGWYFNVYFITTNRIIDVNFFNLIDKRVSDAEIEKIQDVTYSTNGAFETIMNFGDVTIQTAGEVPEFRFESVPSPEKVVKILDDLR
jgi:hypothetical protein